MTADVRITLGAVAYHPKAVTIWEGIRDHLASAGVHAVHEGRADAGAIGDAVWASLQAAGWVNGERVEVLWTTPPFDRGMFDALASLPEATAAAFQRALFAMSWDDPRHRKLLELEGLKAWVEPRESYASLEAALDEQGAW